MTDGKQITFQFDSTGFTGLFLEYAERVTPTGPTSLALSVSNDGSTFTPAGTINLTNRDSSFRPRTVDLTSAGSVIDNQATAYLRVTLSGYTSASGGIRLDNVAFRDVPLPEPTTLALAGAAGIVALRRRRA